MRGQLMKKQIKTAQIIFFKGHNNKRRIKLTINEKITSLKLCFLVNSYRRCWELLVNDKMAESSGPQIIMCKLNKY